MEEEKESIINFENLPRDEQLKVFNLYREYMLNGMFSNCNEDTLMAKASINVLNRLFSLDTFPEIINGLLI